MPRPRKYPNNAARQKAFRQRQKALKERTPLTVTAPLQVRATDGRLLFELGENGAGGARLRMYDESGHVAAALGVGADQRQLVLFAPGSATRALLELSTEDNVAELTLHDSSSGGPVIIRTDDL